MYINVQTKREVQFRLIVLLVRLGYLVHAQCISGKTVGRDVLEMEGTVIYATVFYFRWRLVIHGVIDGFSRMIVFLKCSTKPVLALSCLSERVQSIHLLGVLL